MTKLLGTGARVFLVAVVCGSIASPGLGDDQSTGDCDDYPIALYPDPDAQALAEAELQGFAPGANMVWHPARGTFWFVTLSVPLAQCGPQGDVYTQFITLAKAHPNLFQLNPKEWKRSAPFPCANVGPLAQVLEIQRARIGSHPISHDLIRFTVRRVNGAVTLQAMVGEYLPPATPWLDESLSACPNLNIALARQSVLNSQFTYSIFDACYWIGSDTYSPNGLDTIAFAVGAGWSWQEDPAVARVLFTKST